MDEKIRMPNNRNIILIGFMGVGKTTVGQLLSDRLQRDFIDIDEVIEKHFQMTIPEVFQQFGEPKFREAERNLIREICTTNYNKVISLGGGAFMQEEVREVCNATSNVIFLHLPFEDWKKRYDLIKQGRPLLKDKSFSEIEELFNKRLAIYSSSNSITVNTANLNAEETVEHIIRSLNFT